jgi:hypothetical protein
MQDLRKHRLFGRLALIALAIQLILSFGHVHDHFAHHTALAPHAGQGKVSAPSPAQDDDEQHCSICWTMALSGALVLSAPIAVAPPFVAVASTQPPMVLGQLGESGTVHFQARAPPVSNA